MRDPQDVRLHEAGLDAVTRCQRTVPTSIIAVPARGLRRNVREVFRYEGVRLGLGIKFLYDLGKRCTHWSAGCNGCWCVRVAHRCRPGLLDRNSDVGRYPHLSLIKVAFNGEADVGFGFVA